MTQDNSWYEKGELPPVGTNCIRIDEKVCIVAHIHSGEYRYAVFQGDRSCGYSDHGFLPIKSDREKAIEQMKEIVNSVKADVLTQDLFLGALYDAGFKKADK